jgi:hemoglobin
MQSCRIETKIGLNVNTAAHRRAFSSLLKGEHHNMRKNLMVVTIAVAVAFGCLAPGIASAQATMAKKSLYSRLGGKKAITAVVDQFVSNVAADNRINKFFSAAASDPKRLVMFKGKLVDQICQGTGGPCKYRGKDMKSAHKGMSISEADFNALVEDLVAALNKFNVPQAEQNELLGILGPMKGDIVGQ